MCHSNKYTQITDITMGIDVLNFGVFSLEKRFSKITWLFDWRKDYPMGWSKTLGIEWRQFKGRYVAAMLMRFKVHIEKKRWNKTVIWKTIIFTYSCNKGSDSIPDGHENPINGSTQTFLTNCNTSQIVWQL